MKHNVKITLILVTIFLISQFMGLFITNQYIAKKEISSTGNVTISWKQLPIGIERPQFEETTSYIFIIVGVLIGTVIALIIIKFRKIGLWRLWFFLSVAICLIISFNAFFIPWIAIPVGLGLAIWKIFQTKRYCTQHLRDILVWGDGCNICPDNESILCDNDASYNLCL